MKFSRLKGGIEYEYFDDSELGAYAGYYPIDATSDDTESINRIKSRYEKRIEDVRKFLTFEIPDLKEDSELRDKLADTALRFKQVYNELKNSNDLSFLIKNPKLFSVIFNDPKFLDDINWALP